MADLDLGGGGRQLPDDAQRGEGEGARQYYLFM
jgi:hypothetical protein